MSGKMIIKRDLQSEPIEKGKVSVQVRGKGRTTLNRTQVDIAFVVDTTGSMEDKIVALIQTSSDFVDESSQFNLDLQFALVSFGDVSVQGGKDKVLLEVPLTSDIERMKSGLRKINKNNGFGNEGESALEGIEKALQISYRPSAIKVIVLMTDDYAIQERLSVKEVTNQLKNREFITFVLSIPVGYYQSMAAETGGTWSLISASSNLKDLLEKLREMIKVLIKTVNSIQLTAGGSVSTFLKLNPPKK